MGKLIKDPDNKSASDAQLGRGMMQMLRRALRCWFVFSVLAASLGACSTLSSTPAISVDGSRPIALLPFENLSVTPQADMRLQRLVETRLRRTGVDDVLVYVPGQQDTLKALLNSRKRVDEATRWASVQGAHYAFTGTVHEWQYKSGADREPVVGITISLIELTTGDVLWQANAARSGWGQANLSSTADRVVGELFKQVRFSNSDRTVAVMKGDK
ncbi:MAG: hypothetical protein AB8B64_22675 [Granulosicoccus sp.]